MHLNLDGDTMKPRVLYFAVFVFFSLSGGRFTATFLEHELQFTHSWMISAAMAIQLLSSSICSSWLGSLADSLEAKGGNSSGRLRIMSLGLLLSTVATLMHSVGSFYMHWSTVNTQQTTTEIDTDLDGEDADGGNSQPKIPLLLLVYHLFLRAVFSIGTSACMPVLDGLTLAQLDREGRDKSCYGKERVYGAVSWGLAHMLILGPSLDRFGFKTIYATVLLSFFGCMITFHIYGKSMSATTEYARVSIKVANDDGTKEDEMELPDIAVPVKQPPRIGSKLKSKTSTVEDDIPNNVGSAGAEERLTVAHIVQLLLRRDPILNASYIIALFALWMGMSVVESLIFLFFEYLGGSNAMMGLTVSVTVLFEIPLFHFAPDVLKFLGSPTRMIQWASVAYVVRVIGYSFIPQSHPFWVLFLEPLHGVTIAFAFTSCVAVADTWVPRGYEASGQGFNSMIRSMGQFVGLCIGGVLEGRTLYRVLAAVVTLGSIVLGSGMYWTTERQAEVQEEEPAISQDCKRQEMQLELT